MNTGRPDVSDPSRRGLSNGLNLLIVTQAVDRDDPVLGFFHGWLKEFAGRFETINVICLKEGSHRLPKNVFVHSLGKESGASRVKYIFRFYKYIWQLRNEYDVVFVHMNQEYVLLGWKIWFLLRKRVILWRNHVKGSLATSMAALLSHTVCYTSPQAFVAGLKNAVQMPVGIDTDFFKPNGSANSRSILFLGRLDAVKRPEMLLRALDILANKGVVFSVDIIGNPTPGREAFARELKKDFSSISNVAFRSAIRNDDTLAAYNSHAIYVNLTPSGSFDKTIVEAMASGCVVVVGNGVLRGVVPDELIADVDSAESVAQGIKFALDMDAQVSEKLIQKSRAYVIENHSISLLASRLLILFKSKI